MKGFLRNNSRWVLRLGQGLFLSIFLFSVAWGQTAEKIRVVASIFPLKEFAGAVGGDRAEVHLFLPPGAEVHAWEPKPSEVVKISKADIFVYLGPSLEPWAHKVIKAAQGKGLAVVEAGKGLPFISSDKHGHGEKGPPAHAHGHSHSHKLDPHVWLDFSLGLKIVDSIASAFAKKDPPRAADYRRNAEAYKTRLVELDKQYREALASCRHRRILLGGHAAFGYLARRYGLQQTALSGVNPAAEPTPRRMAEILEQIRKTGVKYIFAEEMVHPKTSRVLAAEAGVEVLLLNPGGNLTVEQSLRNLTFLELMEENLKTLKQGLECPSP
jgi:zinc transport system substrate-binding protein